MSPVEASETLDEPDWIEDFLASERDDDAFENILRRWRRWHWTPIEIDGETKKNPAAATDAIIALAILGIMPPSSLKPRLPGLFEEQIDAHCWLVSKGRAWRVVGVQDRIMELNSFGDKWEINLSRARWDDYVAAASAALEEGRQ